ncbi:MAG: hypothetical protein M1832_005619 [Thelocarpon impressellum]|nr:MAG: hypothetical protein M1832_005619 [Thelocarpon impressellum]
MAQASTPISPLPPSVEMFQKTYSTQSLFNARTQAPRPLSEATEIYDTDFEDDRSEPDANSPRYSVESFGRQSATTLSSFDEVATPSSNHYASFDFQLEERPVEGPRGPHLFRSSQDSGKNTAFHLSMSPLTPKDPSMIPTLTAGAPPMPASTHTQPLSTLTQAVARLDTAEVESWTPQQVAAWMYSTGFEDSVVEKFQLNDISGAILVDLKFEDLKELDIQSFGKRHRLWSEIHNLRGSQSSSPTETPRPRSHESVRRGRRGECGSDEEEPKSHRSRRNRKQFPLNDTVISPAESVSIVGIEQLLPKPHKCSKGERCAKYRRQQRQLAMLAQDHPISPEKGGAIIITGNPGNAVTAESMFRPTSEAEPSVVASSDVLGPGLPADFKLGEDSLRSLQLRDAQENVKQFLSFQHMPIASVEEPATPPFEMFPPLHAKPMQDNLRSLPKLTIPPVRTSSFSPTRSQTAFSPGCGSRTSAWPANTFTSPSNLVASPHSFMSPSHNLRHGTPFSEMDVPVTAVPVGPVARDASQSVPPDMRYRRDSNPRLRSRAESRQPSFAMAKVAEDAVLETGEEAEEVEEAAPEAVKNASHAGWMKKRKTKFLRHEWNEHHFTLNGTTLAMRQHEKSLNSLENIDVDDYAVACSSIQSNKLTAALKSMKLSGARKEEESSAFAFQLVPTADKKHAATGKTHHFAVKSRDQRIDWMRELMLAKALKQKGEGYEINLNGNMI